ncbi:MAG TPA: glycosyltransferase [Pyrinomonadaceae bacterium]|nr:glycosyltransferase [Pyrinomonadaceae bacterium]
MRIYKEEKYAECPQIRQRLTEIKKGRNIAENPRVSVIIPAYNISDFVVETLSSVFAQTYKNFEVILLNDGSKDTDELKKVIEPFFDKLVYAEQSNLGASEARNAAICLSRGELLAFLDGDDIWLPEFLESQIEHLDKNKLDMIYCDAELFGEEHFAGDNFMRTSPSNGEVTTVSLISTECNVITSGTILKKKIVEEIHLFDRKLKRMQDYDLWFRVAGAGAKIGYQKKILVKYRVRADSLSGSNVERASRNIMALNVLKEKYELDEAELKAWDEKMAAYIAEFELEKGKLSLVNGDFVEAEDLIIRANRYYRKPKLFLIIALMKISPKLTVKLFEKIRPAEFSFITPNKS